MGQENSSDRGQFYDWSKAIETGHPDIDGQHKRLFDIINHLKTASKAPNTSESVPKVVSELKDYAAIHFSFEEKVMNSFRYDEILLHKQEHVMFMKKVGEISAGNMSDLELCNKLIEFIFDWLMWHITTIDMVMVTKLEGKFQENFAQDAAMKQTQAVVDGAFKVAGVVERLSLRLENAGAGDQRAELREQLSRASERLINLITLAEMRIEAMGCQSAELARLKTIKAAVDMSAHSLLASAVAGLIEYGTAIISGKHGLPFGIGAALMLQVEKIAALLRVAGGFAGIGGELKDRVIFATDVVNQVVALEANVLAMPNFDMPRDASGTKHRKTGSVGNSYDQEFIVMAQEEAAKIGSLLEHAVESGDIALEALFDEKYLAIPGSNPPQFTTKFLLLTDRLFPPIQEKIVSENELVVFAAAVDRNGYLPTHNRKYSHPQGDDPVWNAANCRNRRIFDDNTGLAAARNQSATLLQTYLRDMGGGDITVMRDVSVPIKVEGRHWGAFRIGYATPHARG
ncbi:MAG: hemerythrin family protein [Alphaproteobacteria bacterium]|nr:hemerythrin family protein [Alphaproteobacteria bacterium]